MKKTTTQATALNNTNTSRFRMHKLAASMLAAVLLPTVALAAGSIPFPDQGGGPNGYPAFGDYHYYYQYNPGGDVYNARLTQKTQKLILDWQNFDLSAGKTFTFAQPDANSIVLNRVHSPNQTVIDGTLYANGQVFIINQNGVLFGQNANVNVGSLLVSTLDISNEDFINNNLKFKNSNALSSTGKIVNFGMLNTTTQGGYVALLSSDSIDNSGTIQVHGAVDGAVTGQVVLLAGKTITLGLNNSNLVNFVIDVPTERMVLVNNSGTIVSPNGSITLSARGTSDILGALITNSGSLAATGMNVNPANGIVTFDAGTNGNIALYASIRNWNGNTITAHNSLRLNAKTILADASPAIGGIPGRKMTILTGNLDATATDGITFRNVTLNSSMTNNGNQTLRSYGGAITLKDVQWNTQGGIALRNYNGSVRLDTVTLAGHDLSIIGTQTVQGTGDNGGWGNALNGDSAVVIKDATLRASDNLWINGQTYVVPTAAGSYGPNGVIIYGVNSFNAANGSIYGYTNAQYQTGGFSTVAGLWLAGFLGLNGDNGKFTLTGVSDSSAAAVHIANLSLNLGNNVEATVTGTGNGVFKNAGLVSRVGNNTLRDSLSNSHYTLKEQDKTLVDIRTTISRNLGLWGI